MKPIFFKDTDELRKWLDENHATEKELWLGYYKKKSPKYNYSWSETVDELICFGWIDGLRKSIDEERYMIRITPRKPKSIWSAVNIAKASKLIKQGSMQLSGLKAFKLKNGNNSKIYSFEQAGAELSSKQQSLFEKNGKAWAFFNVLAPSIKKQCIWWIVSAKREETQLKRLHILITYSGKGEKIPQLNWSKK